MAKKRIVVVKIGTKVIASSDNALDPSTKAQGRSRANEVRRGIDNAKMSLVVLLEHGGKGGLEPSEIAKEIFAIAVSKGYL